MPYFPLSPFPLHWSIYFAPLPHPLPNVWWSSLHSSISHSAPTPSGQMDIFWYLADAKATWLVSLTMTWGSIGDISAERLINYPGSELLWKVKVSELDPPIVQIPGLSRLDQTSTWYKKQPPKFPFCLWRLSCKCDCCMWLILWHLFLNLINITYSPELDWKLPRKINKCFVSNTIMTIHNYSIELILMHLTEMSLKSLFLSLYNDLILQKSCILNPFIFCSMFSNLFEASNGEINNKKRASDQKENL